MQSDQWHPSDIDAAATETPSEPAAKATRRAAEPSAEAPASVPAPETVRKPATGGIMTLDRESAGKTAAAAQEAAQAEAAHSNDVQARFTETAERVKNCLAHWKSGADGEADLSNSLHDLRRVLARIEIELASSHAVDHSQKPIPIPLHRAHKGL